MVLGLLEKLNIQPVRKETNWIEMIMNPTVRKIDVFEVEIKDLSGSFQFKSEVGKVERKTLLTPNPNYESVLKEHHYLRSVTMNGMEKKTELPTYLVFGANNYTKNKSLRDTETRGTW